MFSKLCKEMHYMLLFKGGVPRPTETHGKQRRPLHTSLSSTAHGRVAPCPVKFALVGNFPN